MITGFNTDIQFGGVTYHVQTEDKGLDAPLILSLVYVGGAIIASKRTPYQDLVEAGFDEEVLTERLRRQHKLICAAIRAGRINDLKRMGERETGSRPAIDMTGGAVADTAPHVNGLGGENGAGEILASAAEIGGEAGRPLEMEDPATAGLSATDLGRDSHADGRTGAAAEPLYLSLRDEEGDFRAGQLATIKIHVGRGQYGQHSVGDAEVTVKVLGTSFRPLILTTKTDGEGVAHVRALLPRFTSGRAAIIIRAVADKDVAELRRIIHQG